MAITPVVRGLYLCEDVTVEPGTTNLTLRNCFRGLRVQGLPTAPQPFYLVATLANGWGTVPIAVQISRLDTMAVIYAASVPIMFPDRLGEVRFKFHVRRCVFPGAGEYEVGLWAGPELLSQAPFAVRPLSGD